MFVTSLQARKSAAVHSCSEIVSLSALLAVRCSFAVADSVLSPHASHRYGVHGYTVQYRPQGAVVGASPVRRPAHLDAAGQAPPKIDSTNTHSSPHPHPHPHRRRLSLLLHCLKPVPCSHPLTTAHCSVHFPRLITPFSASFFTHSPLFAFRFSLFPFPFSFHTHTACCPTFNFPVFSHLHTYTPPPTPPTSPPPSSHPPVTRRPKPKQPKQPSCPLDMKRQLLVPLPANFKFTSPKTGSLSYFFFFSFFFWPKHPLFNTHISPLVFYT